MSRIVDMTGKRYGRWTVIEKGKSQHGFAYWLCKCNCLRETVREIAGSHLRVGSSTSCGCIQREKLAKRNVEDSPSRKKVRAREGVNYISSTDYWFKQAKGCWDRAKKRGTPIDFSSPYEFANYCKSIAPEICPVFGVPFKRGSTGYNHWSPSIDKILPQLGYVRGNIQIISNRANLIKQDATPEELKMFANWITTNAQQMET